MKVIAHRGANREAPENSRQAMQIAIDTGADSIEFDIHVSADGIPIVVHDENLNRTTSGKGIVSKLTAKKILESKLSNGETVPTLVEILNLCKGKIAINAEIKSRSRDETRTICELLESQWGTENLIVSSFQLVVVETLAEEFANLERACLVEPRGWTWPSISDSNPLLFMNRCRSVILHPEASMIDQNMMDQAKNRGWIVNAWYPLKGEAAQREDGWSVLHDLGVDGICTNYPRQMREWLSELQRQQQEFSI